MSLPRLLIDLAIRILPPSRRDWGEAMRQELDAISPAETTDFALGCLWAATQERIHLMKLLVTLGRWGVGLVTALYGAFFLKGLVNGVAMAFFSRPDPFYNMLVANHHPEAAAEYLDTYPFMLAFALSMGLSHVAASFFLIRWNARLFTVACAGAAAAGAMLVVYGIMTGADRIPSYTWPFIPLAMLVAAAVVLWWISHPRTPPALAA